MTAGAGRVLLLVPARVMASAGPVAAVVAADTPMLPLAAVLAARMGLPHNSLQAVHAAADKAEQRRLWAAARVAQPGFRVLPAGAAEGDLRQAAAQVGCPCVVKATSLSASQGVLRADDPAAVVAAARRVRQVLAAAGRPGDEPLLVERYVPGPELSIDGLLTAGALTVTAVFDKPCTPEGPTFEETLLITPSRLPGPVLAAAISAAEQAACALGLTITVPVGQPVRPLPDTAPMAPTWASSSPSATPTSRSSRRSVPPASGCAW